MINGFLLQPVSMYHLLALGLLLLGLQATIYITLQSRLSWLTLRVSKVIGACTESAKRMAAVRKLLTRILAEVEK